MKKLEAYMKQPDAPVLVLLTFQVSAELADDFRESLKSEDVSMRSVLEACIRRYLDEQPRRRKKTG